MRNNLPLILASASPRRKTLLEQLGVVCEVIPAAIDETPLKTELPREYVMRIAAAKAGAVAKMHKDRFVLGADTVVASGRRILPKAEDETTARDCLQRLSGRRHRVYTSVHILTPQGKAYQKTVMTQVVFRQLSASDIEAYLASGEWEGKAGGYAIQGCAQAFIPRINGSYSSVVGLPLSETRLLLTGAGFF